jgi:hypothetical protein
LPRRLRHDLDAGVEHVLALGERQARLPAVEEAREVLLEALVHRVEGLAEALAARPVDARDRLAQRFDRRLEIGLLLVEEAHAARPISSCSSIAPMWTSPKPSTRRRRSTACCSRSSRGRSSQSVSELRSTIASASSPSAGVLLAFLAERVETGTTSPGAGGVHVASSTFQRSRMRSSSCTS